MRSWKFKTELGRFHQNLKLRLSKHQILKTKASNSRDKSLEVPNYGTTNFGRVRL
jgi:hypothetical protein